MMQTTENSLSGLYEEVRKSRALIFEFRYNEIANDIVQSNKISFNQQKIDAFIRSNPPLLNYDKVLMNQYW